MLRLLSAAALFLAITRFSSADSDQRCSEWAEMGECDNNPGYMLSECATACERVAEIKYEQEERLRGMTVWDLTAQDIDGNTIRFSDFEGQVTVITNVASYCGYTESHYKSLVELHAEIQGTRGVNILAFPCNQFGKQEPGSAAEIKAFAKKKGVEFTMMKKIDVNGANTSLVYLFLKHETDQHTISWNFATYFVIGPDGSVTAHNGVEPMDLKDDIFQLLAGEEL